MKILVYGAGVIGSIYAARLCMANINATLLARDKRFGNLSKNGIILKDAVTHKQTVTHVPLTKQLASDDFYDLIIVTVRLNQLGSVLAELQKNTASPSILFMVNYPDVQHLINELPQKHSILGFPGVGGIYQDDGIKFIEIKQQKTTIGEIDGTVSKQVKQIEKVFKRAGFKVSLSRNMRAWLKTHAVFIACVSAAIIKENGSSLQLGKKRSSVQTMVKSIHEGFVALNKLGIPVIPGNLKMIFVIMPQWFSVLYWQKALQGKVGTLAMAPHINAAGDEMQLLAKKVLALAHSSSVETPALDKLLSTFINFRLAQNKN